MNHGALFFWIEVYLSGKKYFSRRRLKMIFQMLGNQLKHYHCLWLNLFWAYAVFKCSEAQPIHPPPWTSPEIMTSNWTCPELIFPQVQSLKPVNKGLVGENWTSELTFILFYRKVFTSIRPCSLCVFSNLKFSILFTKLFLPSGKFCLESLQ